MTSHRDTTPTWKQKFEIMRKIFICTMIYDMMNNYPFEYNVDIPIIYPYDSKDDTRHAISTCTLSAFAKATGTQMIVGSRSNGKKHSQIHN